MKWVRTKIVATIGPERRIHVRDGTLSDDPIGYSEMLDGLVGAGADVFRLNLSHSSKNWEREERLLLAYHDASPKWLKKRRFVALMADLQGPKMRLGSVGLDSKGVELRARERFSIHTRSRVSNNDHAATVYYEDKPFAKFAGQVRRGDEIWLGDGEILLEVLRVVGTSGEVLCTVRSGGTVCSFCGVTARGVVFDLESLTAKDRRDLNWLLSNLHDDLTYVAVSFVNTAEDILKVKCFIQDWLEKHHVRPGEIRTRAPWIIAKIETRNAVNNLEEILDVADAVMVARGDLGMQVGLPYVARLQKQIIQKCRARGKPVIVATQMLDSMEHRPVPTRAESTDVYNAIQDGADAIMLSGETAKGEYPIQAVQVMHEIAEVAEEDYFGNLDLSARFLALLEKAEAALQPTRARVKQELEAHGGRSSRAHCYRKEYTVLLELLSKQQTTDSISCAACNLSIDLGVSAIIAPTTSGQTVRMVSRFHPYVPIIGAAHTEWVARKLSVCYGVLPLNILKTYHGRKFQANEEVFEVACDRAQRILVPDGSRKSPTSLIKKGDRVVITAGYPLDQPGTTNLVKLHTV